jgi:hypothetical protein
MVCVKEIIGLSSTEYYKIIRAEPSCTSTPVFTCNLPNSIPLLIPYPWHIATDHFYCSIRSRHGYWTLSFSYDWLVHRRSYCNSNLLFSCERFSTGHIATDVRSQLLMRVNDVHERASLGTEHVSVYSICSRIPRDYSSIPDTTLSNLHRKSIHATGIGKSEHPVRTIHPEAIITAVNKTREADVQFRWVSSHMRSMGLSWTLPGPAPCIVKQAMFSLQRSIHA